MIIGRKLADIILDDVKISSAHAEVRREGDRYFIKDLHSTNGTFVNKKPVSSMALTDQDLIEIGSTSLCFYQSIKDYESQEPTSKSAVTEEDATKIKELTQNAMTTTKTLMQNSLKIEIKKGPNQGKRYVFKKPYVLIGRFDADLTLADVDVSRQHALLEVFSANSVFIRDLGSTNGTFVNGKQIQAEKVAVGDEIVIGNTALAIHCGETEAS